MTSLGRVRIWHDEDGWGVIDSEATPGGCWAHFASVLVAGDHRLAADQEVSFTFEQLEDAEQDGFAFRAEEVWPTDRAPVRSHVHEGQSEAFQSTLTIGFDASETAPPEA